MTANQYRKIYGKVTEEKLDQKLARDKQVVSIARKIQKEVKLEIEYTRLEVLPIGAPRMTQRDRWAKRPAVLRYHKFKDDLRKEIASKGIELNNELYLVYYIPMAKSWTKKKKRQYLGQPHHLKPDTDNITKGYKDALYKEDSAVFIDAAAKFWCETGSGYILHFSDIDSWSRYIKKASK